MEAHGIHGRHGKKQFGKMIELSKKVRLKNTLES
jgi:hypothetical protein